MKRIKIGENLYLDFDKVAAMFVVASKEVSNNQVVDVFRVVAETDYGKQYELLTDTSSGRRDLCDQFITKNWK